MNATNILRTYTNHKNLPPPEYSCVAGLYYTERYIGKVKVDNKTYTSNSGKIHVGDAHEDAANTAIQQLFLKLIVDVENKVDCLVI